MCKCPLPVEAESYESSDLMRWTPNGSGMRRNEVFQLGYVANSIGSEWVYLEYVKL